MRQILLIVIFSAVAQLVLPWWSLALVAFAVCFWRGPGTSVRAFRGRAFRGRASRSSGAWRAFGHGFAGGALVWLLYALLIHLRTDGVLTSRMGQLLFKIDGATLPLLATTLLGGLVGGLAGLAGHFVRRAVVNQPAARNA